MSHDIETALNIYIHRTFIHKRNENKSIKDLDIPQRLKFK